MTRWPPTKTARPRPRPVRLAGLAWALLAVAGCADDPGALGLADLTPGERVVLEKLVVLERAKTAALVDRDRGEALLDSLAAAWGDSFVAATLAGAPRDAARARAVGQLYARVMRAEHDSLLAGDAFGRLRAPVPDPPPPAPEAPAAE
jgi:hypothetical protein